MKVICTIVLILANGYRDVRQEQGIQVKEYQDSWYVTFPDLPQAPLTRWVNNNDCISMPMTEAEVKAWNGTIAWQNAEAKADKLKWQKFHEQLLKGAGK